MISVSKLCVQFSGEELFKDISFFVNTKDRIGLVGRNGAGKTTLLRVFMNEVEPSSGSVSVPSDVKLGYLPQQLNVKDTRSLFEEALTAFEDINKLLVKLEKCNDELAERTDYETESYTELLNKIAELTERLRVMDADTINEMVELTLFGLGFQRKEFVLPTSSFSGGWRMRIELAKIILQKPDVFLLDEPTNHLDIESIQWLENYLKDYNGAVILISHDKRFLDTVTNRTIEISLGKIYDYKAPYSKYVLQRKERHEQQMQAYINQQKTIEQTEDFINRFRYKATKAVQVQSRIKQLNKLDRIEVEEEDKASIYFHFPPAPRTGKVVFEVNGVVKRYGEKLVLNGIDLIVERGEKIAFAGKNGEGKTTFIRCLMKELDFEGSLELGHNVNIGYFAQNQDDLMQADKTVFEILDNAASGDARKNVRKILGSFLFSGDDDINKKVKVLSGGERNRLAMAKLLLEPYNLLILDEPTNHLDIKSKEILKNALLQYDGTLIIVSHDRDFLDGLVETVYEFTNKIVRQHKGGIEHYLYRKSQEKQNEINNTREIEKQKRIVLAEKQPNSYRDKKQLEKEIKKTQNQINKTEENIVKIEAEMEDVTKKLSEPAFANNSILFNEYERLQKLLESEITNWEKLEINIKEFKSER